MSGNKIDEMMGNVVMSDELKNKIREKTVTKVVKYRRPGMKRIVLVATMCVAILGTMTVIAANNAEKIEKYFMNILGYDADTQKELEEDGFYQQMGVAYNEGDIIAVTNDGITVAVKETIVDKNVIKALIQIRSEKDIELDNACYFKEYFIKGLDELTPDAGEGSYEYYSTMEYALEGTDNLDGQWCIVNIENPNGKDFVSGDVLEIEFKQIMKLNWITERLCEIKEGATAMVDGEEYVVTKVGHMDECYHYQMILNDGYYPEGIFDTECVCMTYPDLYSDLEDNLYAFLRVSDGEPYENDDLVVSLSDDGHILAKLIDGNHIDIISDGEWTLKWELNVNDKCIQIPINEIIENDDMSYPIENVQITPCSFKVSFLEDIDDSLGFITLDAQIYMKDGTIYEIGETGEDSGIVTMSIGLKDNWYGFRSVLNLDNIEKISIEGKEYPVSK